jgi:hypothetical protein
MKMIMGYSYGLQQRFYLSIFGEIDYFGKVKILLR